MEGHHHHGLAHRNLSSRVTMAVTVWQTLATAIQRHQSQASLGLETPATAGSMLLVLIQGMTALTVSSATTAAAVASSRDLPNHRNRVTAARKEDAALRETQTLATQVCNRLI